MCENRVSSMAFDSMSFAYGMVVTMCDGMSGLVGLENSKTVLETANFEEKYELLHEIRQGSFSSVHSALLRNSQEEVEVKSFSRLSLSASDANFARSEGEIVKSLYHRHIISCFDFFEEPSHFYIVYEKIQGGLVFERLASRKSLNEKVIRDIFEGVLSAVKYCHDRNIVHRNISTDALLLASTSSHVEEVKLGDFDFASNISSDALTGYFGNPIFMAPEIHKQQLYGKAVDMWSLGVVLYVLLSGNLPFSPRNKVTLRRLVRNGKFEFDMYSWREPSSDAQGMIKRLLTVDGLTRLSAEQALKQSWLNCMDIDMRAVDLTTKIAALKKYNIRCRFRKCIRQYYARASKGSPCKLRDLFMDMYCHLPYTPRASSVPGTNFSFSRSQLPLQKENSESLRQKALSSLSDLGADVDDLSFAEKYSLFEDQELGRGAFAVVVKGALLRNGKQVAIKLVDRTQLSEATEEIMKSEAEMLKTLNHRNVIRCFDFYTEPERFIIVMELVEGGDLLTRLARKTVYSEKDARDLVEILLAAVNHCHQHDIVHRDLKLENLLLVSDRDDNMIKLADFGLAAKATNDLSLSGFCGTPGYVAPEILELRLYGKAVDIWSAGVIVFALLGGYLPFEADSLIKYRQACGLPVYFEPEFWSEVSVEAKDLIMRLLQLDTKTRYTAAQALRHPWLKKSGSVLSRRPLSKTLSQIKVFNLHRKFKAIAHSLIAHAKFMRRLNFGRAQTQRAAQAEADEEAARIAAINKARNAELTAPSKELDAVSSAPSSSRGGLEVETRATPSPTITVSTTTTTEEPKGDSLTPNAVRYDSKYGDLGVHVEVSDLTPTPSPTAESAHRKKSVSFVSDDDASRVISALMGGSSSSPALPESSAADHQLHQQLHASVAAALLGSSPVSEGGPGAPVNSFASSSPNVSVVSSGGEASSYAPIPVFSPALPPRPAIISAHSNNSTEHSGEGASKSSPVGSSPPHSQVSSEVPVVVTVATEVVSMVSSDPAHVFKNMYAIQTHIGKGGFGHVFKANRRDNPDHIVAVKVLERGSITQAEEHRIREESGILQSIKHPNIIEFYDFFEETKVFVIIMEYLDGGELFHRIAKKLYYNEETARNLVRDLLGGIKHCHDRDIVHRDIKAENIIMTNKVDDDKIKLIDFGLAGRASGNTLEGYVGTPGYIAPEIVEMKPHGKPVDMWAIGVITYILLGGYMPFDIRDKTRCRHCVRHGQFEFPDDYWSDVSGDAKNFISKLLVVDTHKRLTVDQALSHPWMRRSDLRHRLLKESSSQMQKFNNRRRFFIISAAIIAKSKFERRKRLANCLSATSLHEALNLTFTDLYDIGLKLGDGGFASVYRAVQRRTDDVVAVKVFDRRSMSPAEQTALHQEKSILLRLAHPHIIKCLDIFEEPSSFYIVMELVSGGELFARLAHKKSYSEEEARNVIVTLLSAIRHCHDNHIVHRDLKPENLLLENDLDDSKIKLIDFGSAAHAVGNTLEGYIGTPGYIAPEMIELRAHGKPVDMWAIGIITYILLVGYLPFEANSRMQYKKKVLRGEVPFDPRHWSKVSPEAQDLIRKLLLLDENNRLTASQALRHPWIRATGVSLRSHDLEGSKIQLAKFNAHRKFRSIARLIIARAKFLKIMQCARSVSASDPVAPGLAPRLSRASTVNTTNMARMINNNDNTSNGSGGKGGTKLKRAVSEAGPALGGFTRMNTSRPEEDKDGNKDLLGDIEVAVAAEEEEVVEDAGIEEVVEEDDIPFARKYELQGELGRGGFGTVYRASSLINSSKGIATGQSVAVKVLDRTRLSPKAEAQVRNEACILLSMSHPNIIRCFDFYEDPSTFFIVMEIMEGGELFDRIVKKVFYSENEARDVVRMLLHAIKHCHDHDVVHRDLKPENLLLASKTDDDKVKLIDFGLSGIASGLTLEGYVGTPGYTAPELFERKPHGKPVDMWAVGVISYVLLAGYLPFKATPRAKYQQMARRGRLEFHPEYWAEVSAEAKDLISNLMRVKVEKRYTVDQALAHPWLKASPILLRRNTLNKSMNSLRKFNAARKFRVICKLIIAHSKFLVRMSGARSSAALVQELVEQRLSFPEKYELMEVLGKGGFATVYKAAHRKSAAASRFGNFVAVKQIERTNLSGKDEHALRNEVAILQSLSHPHIIKCLDVFEESSTFFIVTELVEGGELFTRLVERTTYSEQEARDLVEILLSTIKHCHDHQVVHRDLKPENLLLVSAKYSHNIKLIDFGLAGVAEGNTLEGYVGSPGYIAPEIVELKPHGKPVDMFSIGVIAYALLGGYLPFECTTRSVYKKQVLRGRVEFHAPYWNNVSADAKDLIKKLLTDRVDRRPTAAQALQHHWITQPAALLKGRDLKSGLVQLKRFNAHRKFRSVVNLLIAKAKFEKIVEAAKLTRISVHAAPSPCPSPPTVPAVPETVNRNNNGHPPLPPV